MKFTRSLTHPGQERSLYIRIPSQDEAQNENVTTASDDQPDPLLLSSPALSAGTSSATLLTNTEPFSPLSGYYNITPVLYHQSQSHWDHHHHYSPFANEEDEHAHDQGAEELGGSSTGNLPGLHSSRSSQESHLLPLTPTYVSPYHHHHPVIINGDHLHHFAVNHLPPTSAKLLAGQGYLKSVIRPIDEEQPQRSSLSFDGHDRETRPDLPTPPNQRPRLHSRQSHNTSKNPLAVYDRLSKLDKECVRSLVYLIIICLGSIASLVLICKTLPEMSLPTSIRAIKSEIVTLKEFSSRSWINSLHLKFIIGSLFIFKQAFSIPGSILINILMGAIYDVKLATILSCLFTSVGSSLAYYCSRISKPLIRRLIPSVIDLLQRKLERFQIDQAHEEVQELESPQELDGDDDDRCPYYKRYCRNSTKRPKYDVYELWSFLLVARLVPIIPYSALNLAAGVLEIPIGAFFWSLMIGSLPYNLITCQVGEIMSEGIEIEKFEEIWNAKMVFKLVGISLIGLIPIIIKNRTLKSFVGRCIEKSIGLKRRFR